MTSEKMTPKKLPMGAMPQGTDVYEEQDRVWVMGFAREFYTMWTKTDVIIYNKRGGQMRGTFYHYYQNLSKSEFSAKAKMERKVGSGEYEIDPTLRGSQSYWKNGSRNTWAYDDDRMQFGKFEGGLISDVEDEAYLTWYYNQVKDRTEDGNAQCVAAVLKNRGYALVGTRWMTKEELEYHQERERINKKVEAGNGFHGAEGQRIVIAGEVAKKFSFESQWGIVFLLSILTSDGKTYYYKGSKHEAFGYEVGDKIEIKGSIAYSEYVDREGVAHKQTMLKRPVFSAKPS